MVSCLVGNSDGSTACLFIDDLAGRLANRVQISTDGPKLYLEAIEDAGVTTRVWGAIGYCRFDLMDYRRKNFSAKQKGESQARPLACSLELLRAIPRVAARKVSLPELARPPNHTL